MPCLAPITKRIHGVLMVVEGDEQKKYLSKWFAFVDINEP